MIRFKDSFTVADNPLFSAVLLGGKVKESGISFEPGWRANAWVVKKIYELSN